MVLVACRSPLNARPSQARRPSNKHNFPVSQDVLYLRYYGLLWGASSGALVALGAVCGSRWCTRRENASELPELWSAGGVGWNIRRIGIGI